MNDRVFPEQFLVAFSFAGEQRDLVRSVAEAVERQLGRGTVFFDEWYESAIVGKNADLRLQEIYGKRSTLVVPCISQRYGEKPWTLIEWEALRAFEQGLRSSTDKRRLLGLRVGDGEVEGVLCNAVFPDIRRRSVRQAAQLIISRLREFAANGVKEAPPEVRPETAKPRTIFLAEVTAGLEKQRNQLKGFLEVGGWTVLPTTDYDDEDFRTPMTRDMEGALAFVQLLGPDPWDRDRDHEQYRVARDCGKPTFRHRSSSLDWTKLDSSLAAQSADVIQTGFQDFKDHLAMELLKLGQAAGEHPYVRVAIHSGNPSPLWEKIYNWAAEKAQVRVDLVERPENFERQYEVEPCDGYLIVCDGDAPLEGPASPRTDLASCRLLQMKEKDAAKRPPIGLVYWPPQLPPWPALLKSTPPRLHKITGSSLTVDLPAFFADVKKAVR